MCLYGFIPVFGGSYPPIHHPALCPDSSLHWQPHSCHPFHCSLYTDIWTCFHPSAPCCSHSDGSLKVEWVAELLANNPHHPPLWSQPHWPALFLFSIFRHLHVWFISLLPTSFYPWPCSIAPSPLLPLHMSLVLLRVFLLLFGQTLSFGQATWDGLDRNSINKEELIRIVEVGISCFLAYIWVKFKLATLNWPLAPSPLGIKTWNLFPARG